MPITLITGTPGAGKTLYTVRLLVEKIAQEGRHVFHNINGLDLRELAKLGLNPFLIQRCGEEGPLDWFEYPDGSIFIFDEVQRQYPPRNTMSKVPRHISEYETHRHRGMDFYFVTQGPRLIDRHLHDLITKHVHLYRPFGVKMSQVYTWNLVNPNPNPAQSKSNSVNASFRFPPKLYKLYRSASMHTVKRQIPWKVVGYATGAVALAVWAIWAVPGRIAASIGSGSQVAEDVTEGFEPECDGYAVGVSGRVLIVNTSGGIIRLPFSEVASQGETAQIVITRTGMTICGVSMDG